MIIPVTLHLRLHIVIPRTLLLVRQRWVWRVYVRIQAHGFDVDDATSGCMHHAIGDDFDIQLAHSFSCIPSIMVNLCACHVRVAW